ncbi:MAG TPA: MarR family transcriptional regulator [Microlunatus sp.]|nr:MarR family transcriptional regulator [Microlunatus sp.]
MLQTQLRGELRQSILDAFVGIIILVMRLDGFVEFFDVLVRYEVALWGAVDGELARHGELSLAQLHALRVVDRYGGRARVQDLSDDIGITVGAASKLVDRLERDGLAFRSPNPANRRSSLVGLTAAGGEALVSALHVCRAAVAGAVGGEDLEAVTAVLRRLQTRLDESGMGAVA